MAGGTPFAHAAFAEKVGIDYGVLADYNWEAAKAFGLFYENGADLHELVADYSPVNTRGAFLIDTDGTVKYAWTTADVTVLPEPQPLLDAA